MGLGGPQGDEQRLGDLPVGLALRGELGHPQLAGGQRVTPAEGLAARPAARDDGLGAGPFRQREASVGVGQAEGRAQRRAGLDAGSGTPQCGAQVGQRAGALQPRRAIAENVGRLGEQLESAPAAGGQPGGAKRDTDGTAGARAAARAAGGIRPSWSRTRRETAAGVIRRTWPASAACPGTPAPSRTRDPGSIFYDPATANPAVVAVDEANKDTVTVPELVSATSIIGLPPAQQPTYQITVPALSVVGEDDDLFCAGVTV